MSTPTILPPLTKGKQPRLPTVSDRTLDNGLRVLAVRRPGVPLVEARLRVPFAGPTGKRAVGFTAQVQLLGETMLMGTDRRTAAQIAVDLQTLGGSLSASVDADRLSVGASALSSGLPALLELVGELLTGASYPKHEVIGERERLVQELLIYRSQPGVIAREALMDRLYGDHPYGRELPTSNQVSEVKPGDVRRLHRRYVSPAGSILVLVGDLSPTRAIAQVEKALAGWQSAGSDASVPELPWYEPGPALLVDRPGAVQTSLRMAGPAPRRTDPDHAAMSLANLVFGGYFSSRWVANIREDKGYTYSPHSVVEHPTAGSRITLATDVATEVTAPALVETLYELGRVATLPVAQAELDQARRYAVGALALSTSTQSGLAGTLSVLAAAGLGVEWLREHPARLATVTVEQAHQAASTYLAPTALTTVLVGDADRVQDPLLAVTDLER